MGNFTTFTANHIQDASGVPLASGQLSIYGSDLTGRPVPFQAGGSGLVHNEPICVTVTNGAISSFPIANSDHTYPANIAYLITVVDNTTGRIILSAGPTQINGDTWSLDNYEPTMPALALVQTGPTGPPGPASVVTGTGASGSWTAASFFGDGSGLTYNTGLFHAALRTLASRLADQLSITEFGAKCDGTTDDTQAVNDAINYCSATGQAVYIPASANGCVVSQITLQANTHLIGVHKALNGYSSGLKQKVGSTGALINYASSGGSQTFWGAIVGLTLKGNSAASTSNIAINLDRAWGAFVLDNQIDGFGSSAIRIGAGLANRVHFNTCVNCLMYTAGIVAWTGIIDTNTTDDYVEDNEASCQGAEGGSFSTDTYTGSTVVPYLAAFCFRGANSFIRFNVGEFSTAGFYFAVNANLFTVVGNRADYNYRTGFYNEGDHNTFSANKALKNAMAAGDGDAFYTTGYANLYVGNYVSKYGVNFQVRDAFRDNNNTNSGPNAYYANYVEGGSYSGLDYNIMVNPALGDWAGGGATIAAGAGAVGATVGISNGANMRGGVFWVFPASNTTVGAAICTITFAQRWSGLNGIVLTFGPYNSQACGVANNFWPSTTNNTFTVNSNVALAAGNPYYFVYTAATY